MADLGATTEAANAADSSPDKQNADDFVLRNVQNDPSAWLQVVPILKNSQSLTTKLSALQILGGIIKDRWTKLPTGECEVIESHITNTISELSSCEISFRQEWLYVCELDKILVQMLKYYSEPRRVSVIHDMMTAASSSDTRFENCMIILRFLSEEYLSGGEMSQKTVQGLKSLLISKLFLIYETCVEALSSEKNDLVLSTLAMVRSSITWFPIDLIFKPPLLENVLKLFASAPFRNLAIQCLIEVVSLNATEFYQTDYVKMYKHLMRQLKCLPLQMLLEGYAGAPAGDQDFIRHLALFFTSLFKNHIHMLEQNMKSRAVFLEGLKCLVKISNINVPEILKVCLEYWNMFVLRLFEEIQVEPSTGDQQAQSIPGVGNHADSIVEQRRQLYSELIKKLQELAISMENHQEVMIGQIAKDILVRAESINLSDDEIAAKLDKLIKTKNGKMVEDNFFTRWSDKKKRQYYESTLFRLPVPRLIKSNCETIQNSVIFDTTKLETIKENYLRAINKYRAWQLAGSDKVYEIGPGGQKVWVTRKNETFVFWYRYEKFDVGLIIDGQTGWVEGFMRRTHNEDNVPSYKPALQFSRRGGAFIEATKMSKIQIERSELEHSYIKSKDLQILQIGGTYYGSVCRLKLLPFRLHASVNRIYEYNGGAFPSGSSDTLVLYSTEAGKNSLLFQFTMESLEEMDEPVRIPLSLDNTVVKHDKVSSHVLDAMEKLIDGSVAPDNGQHFNLVEGAPFRTLLQCVEAYRILKRKKVHPTKFYLQDCESEYYKQNKRRKIVKKNESYDKFYERQCAEDVRVGTLYKEALHGGDRKLHSEDLNLHGEDLNLHGGVPAQPALFPMPPRPFPNRKWYHYPDAEI